MKNQQIGEILRARRKEKGLTLTDVFERSRVSTSHINRIENGERFPSASVLQALAGPLGYEEAELLKLAGLLTPDGTDTRIADIKQTLKAEIESTMTNLLQKVEAL